MPTYIFQGRVLPERAQLTMDIRKIGIRTQNQDWILSVSIILNQITVFLDADSDDIFTLRNFVHDFLSAQLSVTGFTHGHYYDVEITRVVTPDQRCDYVFGIEMPCISLRRESLVPSMSPEALGMLTLATHGHFLRRFFTDFTLAMKNAIDTPFYCYRSIEALRQHCAACNYQQTGKADKAKQWELFKQRSETSKEDILQITEASHDVRHGGIKDITDEQRQVLLTRTWEIAERYFRKLLEIN